MNVILILGAGRSSASLIRYLLEHAASAGWKILLGDISETAARQRLAGAVHGEFVPFDIFREEESAGTIAKADVVVSLLPASFHPLVARYCLMMKKHLLTASYVTDEMSAYHSEAVANGLLFLNECGLDPGIDHMSAMQLIDRIRDGGGSIVSFESFTGGLITAQTDPLNPWRYKFTWNPRNVVMAGQGTAKYLDHGRFKYIPYQQLFRRTSEFDIPALGQFEGYANRDSLRYISTYGLSGIQTMLRGTLRYPGFCSAWDTFVQLGCCDDSYGMEGVADMTHVDFLSSFLPEGDPLQQLRSKIALWNSAGAAKVWEKLEWAGLLSREQIGLESGTPAQILEHILNKKWKLAEGDKDLIVMQHRFVYDQGGRRERINASLVCIGQDQVHTAMAKTVGLPLGIATRLLLMGKIKSRGVVIPVTREFYDPILAELSENGIELTEEKIA
jgi:saccharopine dehydrogenase-like NADP-dependent oxidoreductase